MYNYTTFDKDFLSSRVAQFRDQVQRRIDGSLTEDEFRPLRLMNGLYLLLHAYMLRVAIPYGTLSSSQMHGLADVADRFDKGYAHFTTRQNVQYHWPKLQDVPEILDVLSKVHMHAVQSSGSCIRSITSDHFAGAALDEDEDPRPTAELVRQWSTDHPEFAFLPRKFKVAVIGSKTDRAVTNMHDIGITLVRDEAGNPGYKFSVGGGLGRTPFVGKVVREFLPREDLVPYLEAILQIYNQIGRRDNKYKARIKITLHEHGVEEIRERIEEDFRQQKSVYSGADQNIVTRIQNDFAEPAYKQASVESFETTRQADPLFRSFTDTNLHPHKQANYTIVTVSLKAHGQTPGDASSEQMRVLAKIAKKWSHDELRVSHEQNIVLPHVHKGDLAEVYAALKDAGLATANIGLISDLISCPGMDYCDLATARSTNIAQGIAIRFYELKLEHDIGQIKVKISGCINACAHHHVAHIGILGLEKRGVESYQITLGGDAGTNAVIGKPMGPGFASDEIIPAMERLIFAYLDVRTDAGETFLETFRRLGAAPFKTAVYEEKVNTNAA